MEWTRLTYEATHRFPDSERFGLTSQLRRSAVSVPSNIAEATGRSSDADLSRFLEIAYGSLMEAVCQSKLALDFGYMSESDYLSLRAKGQEIARMLSGLRRYRSEH
jgi:four helix bundle protein